jgi:hypothetical protein
MAELNDIGSISDFLSVAECDEYIRVAESKGFEDAAITTGRGPVMMKEVRNNDRVMFDEVDRAQELRQASNCPVASQGNPLLGLGDYGRARRSI